MDYTRYDRVRRSTTPPQLDVVEAFARGRLSRREFIKRGTIVGLSMASISAILIACDTPPAASVAPPAGSPGASPSGGAAASPGQTGGTIRVAVQRPAATLDPIAMQDLSAYGLLAQSFEFLVALDPATSDIGPGLATEWTPNDDNTRLDVQAPHRRQVAEGRRLHGRRRRRDHGSPGRSRQRWPGWRDREGLDQGGRPHHGRVHAARRQRQLPVPRVGIQRAVTHHTRRVRDEHHP